MSTAKDLANALKASSGKTSAYDSTATVTRIEGGTAWVHIPGGVSETPASMTIDAKPGDTVQVRVSGGRAFLVGNSTAPPTDDTAALLAQTRAEVARLSATVAQKIADTASETADGAKRTANAILVFDTTYVIENGTARFTAYLYRGGVDVKTQYDPSMFTWYLKTEAGETYLGHGYTAEVSIEDCGYGAEVIGRFTSTEDSEALTAGGDNLTDSSGTNLTVRATGEQVKVRNLETVTVIHDAEKLMVVGVSDEHLVTMDTLYSYLLGRLEAEGATIYCGSATELVG